MDPRRFDSLVRSLTTLRTRRSLTRLAGGLTLSTLFAVVGNEEVAAGARLGGARCTKKSQCKSRKCLNPDTCDCAEESCACTCACSKAKPRVGCVKPDDPCEMAICSATGQCTIQPMSCDDDNPCTQDLCDGGVCSHPPDLTKNGDSCGNGNICQDGVCGL